MNLDRSSLAVLATLLAVSCAMGCSKAEPAADSTEGAASAADDGKYKAAEPGDQEFRLAPLNAQTCVDATAAVTGEERTIGLNKCLVFSSHAYFKPSAGHVAVSCMLEAGKGNGTKLTATEITKCRDRGLYSIAEGARTPETDAFCNSAVSALKASGVADPGNGALQRCKWIHPGLATEGLKELKACLEGPDATKVASEKFNSCLDSLGTVAKK